MSTLSIEIRRARPNDATTIAAVHDATWRQAYQGILPGVELERMIGRRGPIWWRRAIRSDVMVLALEVGGAVVGYATLGPSRMRTLPFRGEVYEIYLLPEYQGLGFGTRLFAAARRALGDLKLHGVAVRALKANRGAAAFYRRLGGLNVAETSERIAGVPMPIVIYGWAGG